MSDVLTPEPKAPSSPFRRKRLLLALGPVAGTLGAWVGVAFGIDGPRGLLLLSEIPPGDRVPLLATASFFASLLTLVALGVGRDRGRPLHAIKASSTIAVVHFFPWLLVGFLIASMGV